MMTGGRWIAVAFAALFVPDAASAIAEWTALGPFESGGGSFAGTVAFSRDGATLFTGSGSKVFRSHDAGLHWSETDLPGAGTFYAPEVTRVVLHPTDPAILYAATNFGVYRSSDGGDSWEASGLQDQFVHALAAAPDSPGTLYASTYPQFGRATPGILKSIDDGQTWFQVYRVTDGYYVASLTVDPANAEIVYAGTYSGALLRSKNGGGTWEEVAHPGSAVISIAVDPAQHETVYASWTFTIAWEGSLHTGAVLRSVDGGDTWSAVPGLPQIDVGQVVLDPVEPWIVYADAGGSLHRSSDRGETWLPVGPTIFAQQLAVNPAARSQIFAASLGIYRLDTTPPCASNAVTLCLHEARFRVTASFQLTPLGPSFEAQAVPIASDSGYFWFFAADNVELIVKVLDGTAVNGHFWVFAAGLSSVDYAVVVTDTLTGETRTYRHPRGDLESVADTQAFSSPGAHPASARERLAPVPRSTPVWTAIGPYAADNPEILSIAVDPRSSAVIYAGFYDSRATDITSMYGILKSPDGGATWTHVEALTLDEIPLLLLADHLVPDTVYAFTTSHVLRTVDGGVGWSVFAPELGAFSLAFDPRGPLYAGTAAGVYRSIDHGSTWTPRGPELAGAAVGLIAVDPSSPDTLYANAQAGGIWKSHDAGASWIHVSDLPVEGLTALLVDPNDSRILYAGTSCCAVWPGSTPLPPVPIYRSEDAGSTWSETLSVTGGQSSLAVDPTSPGAIYAGGNSGAYRSVDFGANWTPLAAGISWRPVFGLALAPGSVLYAGSFDGAFKLDLREFPPSCPSDGRSLCLDHGRFQVRSSWQPTPLGPSASAHASTLTDSAGYFWFFDSANVELVVKVVDGTLVNGHLWIFIGGLSSVDYSVVVTDTLTGSVKTYAHARGDPESLADTSAF